MSLLDNWREKRKEGKELREEKGFVGGLKKILADGKEDIKEDLDNSGVTESYTEGKKVGERKFDDDPVSINCRECQGEVESDSITRCPHCGYDPTDHKTWFYIHILLTGILGATIIGLIFAPFTIWKARKHRMKSKRGVAKKRWE